jgi:hypothetical protein
VFFVLNLQEKSCREKVPHVKFDPQFAKKSIQMMHFKEDYVTRGRKAAVRELVFEKLVIFLPITKVCSI